jgi:hypothetical protein
MKPAERWSSLSTADHLQHAVRRKKTRHAIS